MIETRKRIGQEELKKSLSKENIKQITDPLGVYAQLEDGIYYSPERGGSVFIKGIEIDEGITNDITEEPFIGLHLINSQVMSISGIPRLFVVGSDVGYIYGPKNDNELPFMGIHFQKSKIDTISICPPTIFKFLSIEDSEIESFSVENMICDITKETPFTLRRSSFSRDFFMKVIPDPRTDKAPDFIIHASKTTAELLRLAGIAQPIKVYRE